MLKITLKYRLHAETSCLKYRWYGECSKYRNALYIMLKSRDIHTYSNSELYNVVIIHRAQDIRWATDNSDQFCCMSDHFSEISSQV